MQIISQQVCPLQILQRNSADVLEEALLQQSSCTVRSQDFDFAGRIASFEKAGPNSIAFNSVGACRSQPHSFQLHCEVHDVSRAFASTFDGLLVPHVSGMISCALSLRSPGMLAYFRQSLSEEVASRLVVLHGHPSPETQAHKERVLATMTTGASKNIPQLLVLTYLPNGDWPSTQIQRYITTADSEPQRGI